MNGLGILIMLPTGVFHQDPGRVRLEAGQELVACKHCGQKTPVERQFIWRRQVRQARNKYRVVEAGRLCLACVLLELNTVSGFTQVPGEALVLDWPGPLGSESAEQLIRERIAQV